jgi:TetR/AcrR family transcriptional repressor of nem operon
MSRHQEFDYDEVLYGAMKVFWKKGYEATSISDLLKATGLSKSSLYATFNGKRNLFLIAFDTYRNARKAEAIEILKQSPARKAIENFYKLIIKGAENDEFSNGCMSINQAVEMAPHDEDVQTKVEQDFITLENLLADAIKNGRNDGSINGLRTPEELARMLVIAFPGLQVMARAKCNQKRLDNGLNLILSLLDEK